MYISVKQKVKSIFVKTILFVKFQNWIISPNAGYFLFLTNTIKIVHI